jgi:hypothetical protein
LAFELRIVEQQVSELRALLPQVDLGHAFGFAFELRGGNADQFGEYVSGIAESEGLIEVTREDIPF